MCSSDLVKVASAHIDGALYHGDSGTLFAERLQELGAKVSIRSTLNVGALDLTGCSTNRLPPHERDMAKRLMKAYIAIGCEPSWTCAPYQAGHRPRLGEHVAWGESNALGHRLGFGRQPCDAVMLQIERADIERRRHGDVTALGRQQLREQHAALAVVEAAIDMGRGDRHQRCGTHQARRFDDDPHRALCGLAMAALQRDAFGCLQVHRVRRSLRRGSG